MHGVFQWMEHCARLDISFPVRVLGAAVGRNTPAHDAAMTRLVSWTLSHATDGIAYGGDKAARTKGFAAWAETSFADGFKVLSTQVSVMNFNSGVVAWSA